ncbi:MULTISPECIES: lipocalin family protein [Halomonadaceae]|uniref:Outer membrane lipoprotein Blc n=1 Tax=Onishia taeanensis TaxID=284577 RepID=A0A328Y1L7_9GAMM|nr:MULTISPECIES: lipocalin family protein [Halomonas]RAR62968.1 apolipoprotein D and lipocalin family protein [Halomonas taeanensis]
MPPRDLTHRPAHRPSRHPFTIALPLVASGLLAGCTGIPEGTQAVEDFNLDRYLGQWYEIARLDHSFEEGLDCVTADYSMRDDGGVKVINAGVNLETGEPSVAEGKAYFIDEPSVARLKVSFFGPFYGGYNVLELDPDYQHALVVGPNRDYLWILARTPTMAPDTYQALVDRVAELDFAVDDLIEVEQDRACAPYRQGT